MTVAKIRDIVSYEHLDEGLNYDKKTKSYTDGEIIYHLDTLNDGNCTVIKVFFKSEPNIIINFERWDYDEERSWLRNVFNERTKKKLTNVWYAEKGFCFLDGKIN